MTSKHATVWSWLLALIIMVSVTAFAIAQLVGVTDVSQSTFLIVFNTAFMAAVFLTAFHVRWKGRAAI